MLWPATGCVEVHRMFVRDQVVLNAVDEEGRHLHPTYFFVVVKAVFDNVLEEAARLVFDNLTDRLEAGHEDDGGWVATARQVRRGARAHAAAEYHHVLLVDTENHIQIIENVSAVVQYVLLA